ncbi:MAG TPA: hypothetical protein VHK91_11065 [Flavisolibacter sp.]|jgi:hypothetical protein|nr:hypothetical protein [Flavisolibacter sp.]
MYLPYRLPAFLDFLAEHYYNLYKIYSGHLTELFPASEPDENNLLISEDETTTKENNELLLQLWRRFRF